MYFKYFKNTLSIKITWSKYFFFKYLKNTCIYIYIYIYIYLQQVSSKQSKYFKYQVQVPKWKSTWSSLLQVLFIKKIYFKYLYLKYCPALDMSHKMPGATYWYCYILHFDSCNFDIDIDIDVCYFDTVHVIAKPG